MAKKYTCPPQTASGGGTFSDNLVGFQLVQGGGLTQGNFEFTNSITEKTNREFTTGVFSNPINLEDMGMDDVNQGKAIFENNYKVYPNFDLSQITNFTLYGSMVKRISSSIENIINNFPAALESLTYGNDFVSGNTAINIEYNEIADQTKFDLPLSRIKNPFDIDFSVNASRINRINVIYHVRDTEPQQASGYKVILNQTKYKDLTLSKTFFKKTINYKNFY